MIDFFFWVITRLFSERERDVLELSRASVEYHTVLISAFPGVITATEFTADA